MTVSPADAAAAAAAPAPGSRSNVTKRPLPRAVLRACGCSGGAVSPHSQIRSTPKAAAVLMIEPTLNGWLTESSRSPTLAWACWRQDRFSRLTSVGPSGLGLDAPGSDLAAG